MERARAVGCRWFLAVRGKSWFVRPFESMFQVENEVEGNFWGRACVVVVVVIRRLSRRRRRRRRRQFNN